ncbi:MAG: ABC transporter substrate-binding protein [Treponema sp.]|uniref:ABC transporter substrate-binding protein n=1 Tax=Treponema sp. TaxID=166 RepID=UPI003FA2039F
MKNMKKILSILILCMSVSLTLFAGGQSEEKAQGGKTKIYFANYALLEKAYTAFWEKVKADFEAKYPQYEVEYLTAGYNDMLSFVTNRVGGGDKVDIIFGEVTWAAGLADGGIITSVDQVLPQSFLADFHPTALNSFEYKGKIVGMPCYYSPTVLFYNKNLFKKAGLDPNKPPKTYDEILKYAEKLSKLTTDKGERVYAFGLPFASGVAAGNSINSVILSFGGKLLDDNGKLSINNQGFKDAMNFYKVLDDNKYNPQNCLPKALRQMFATQSLAMYYDQSGGFSGVSNINPNAKDFAAIAPAVSGGTGDGSTLIQANCFLLANNGKKSAEGTAALVQFIMSKEVMGDYLANLYPSFPSLKSLDSITLYPILNSLKGSKLKLAKQTNIGTMNKLHLELAKAVQAITISKTEVNTAIKDFEKQAEIILR